MAIINHSHKFVFVHIPKAAGTSITSEFSRHTNYCDQEIGGTEFGESIQSAYKKRFSLAKHSPASRIKAVMGDVFWNRYFSFSFVRNPYRRCISTYNFLKTWPGTPDKFKKIFQSFASFEDYVDSNIWDDTTGPDDILRPQVHWVRTSPASTDLVVNYIGKVESIDVDLEKIRKILDIRPDHTVSRNIRQLNVTPVGDSPRKLSDKIASRIYQKYKLDFLTFGYSEDPTKIEP